MGQYTKGKHPNSLANLAKAYGGRGGFDTEGARKAQALRWVKHNRIKALERHFTGLTPEALELDRMIAEWERADALSLRAEALERYREARLEDSRRRG